MEYKVADDKSTLTRLRMRNFVFTSRDTHTLLRFNLHGTVASIRSSRSMQVRYTAADEVAEQASTIPFCCSIWMLRPRISGYL